MEIELVKKGVMLASMTVSEPTFIQKIKDNKLQDSNLAKIV